MSKLFCGFQEKNYGFDGFRLASNAYPVNFCEAFQDGILTVSFQIRRTPGAGCFEIRLNGIPEELTTVIFEADCLRAGKAGGKVLSSKYKPVSIPADEWCQARITYSRIFGFLTTSAVITDGQGEVLASVVAAPVKNDARSASGLLLSGASGWDIKDMTVQIGSMKCGDRMKLPYDTVIPAEGVAFHCLSINGEHTFKPYFGRYCVLPDLSGFICGTEDGSFYLYDIVKQELVFLDRCKPTFSPFNDLDVYVHPITGNLFYRQINKKGLSIIYRMDPHTLEKTKLFEADDPEMFVYIEVTNDERYTCYYIGGYMEANAPTKVGRIDLKTGKLELERELVYPSKYCVNHFILNPEHPELLLFHREGHVGINESDHTNLLNLETGEITTYLQPTTLSAHALWTHDGENVVVTDYYPPDGHKNIAILTQKLKSLETYQIDDGNHIVTDYSKNWAFHSDQLSGMSLTDLQNRKTYKISDKEGLEFPLPDISRNGELLLWAYVNRNGVRCVAWTKNPMLAK